MASGPSGHLVHLLWEQVDKWLRPLGPLGHTCSGGGKWASGFGTKWPLGPLARGASGFGHLAHLATLAQVGASGQVASGPSGHLVHLLGHTCSGGQVASGPSGHLVHLLGGQVASATWSTWPHLLRWGEVGKWLRDQVATWSNC